jgi:hypothetical protein
VKVNETFFDNEPFIAKQTLFLRHDFVNRIVFNLIGLDWILRIIGKSFLYVKEKVAQDVGVGVVDDGEDVSRRSSL